MLHYQPQEILEVDRTDPGAAGDLPDHGPPKHIYWLFTFNYELIVSDTQQTQTWILTFCGSVV